MLKKKIHIVRCMFMSAKDKMIDLMEHEDLDVDTGPKSMFGHEESKCAKIRPSGCSS